MTTFCFLLTSLLNKSFWKEIYAFEAITCLLETFNSKNFGKTLFFLQDIENSKSKNVFLSLTSIFFGLLKSLEDQGEISEKEIKDLRPSGSQAEVFVCMGFPKSIKH